jgi:putative endopeptidase
VKKFFGPFSEKRTAILASLALAAAAPIVGTWGFDSAGMDRTVKPGDDFFRYANGGWDRATAIPEDRSGYGVDYVIADEAERRVRTILESDPAAVSGPAHADAEKVHAAWLAFMDEARVEKLGARPIAGDLAAIRALGDRAALAGWMGRASTGFEGSVFDLGISEDLKAPSRYAIYITQSGLGLPDRDYYLQPEFAAKKAAYGAYVAEMLGLAGWADAAAGAKDVVAFETRIAQGSWTLAERRDPEKSYNPMSPAQLEAEAPGFAWAPFLQAAGIGSASRLVVGEKTAIVKIAALYGETPLPVLKAWAAFHLADAAAPYLSKSFDDARFAFRGKTLAGQPKQRERWKRGVAFLDGMGEAVGRVYVARYFPPDAKAKIDALVAELRVSLNRRIDRLDWMGADTKARAHAKLAQFTVKIAYPDRWRDYSALQVSSVGLVGDARAFEAFEWHRQVARLDKPVDRSEWGMTPQTVNAYYNPSQNEIVFPAAILQAPYFDPNADAAVNYGGIGAVIGHEMTHGFDDEGRKFDGTGALADWWTKEDAVRFEARARTLGAQFDSYQPFPGVHIKGDQTMGENIADLGGILIALDAYHSALGGKSAPVIDGLTGDQRFFLAYAQSWRDKRREDSVREQLVSDVHSPEVFRVNGVVRNVDAWYGAFGVIPGQLLYLPPAGRARIW